MAKPLDSTVADHVWPPGNQIWLVCGRILLARPPPVPLEQEGFIVYFLFFIFEKDKYEYRCNRMAHIKEFVALWLPRLWLRRPGLDMSFYLKT